MTVPARNVRCAFAEHRLRFNDKIVQDFVERGSHVHVAIGKRRAVMKHEQLPIFARLLDSLVEPRFIPHLQQLRLPRDQIRLHRKIRARKIERVFVILAHRGARTLTFTPSQINAVPAAEHIVVTGEPLPSAYGAPTSFSQSRFSPLTNAYVLPPGAVYASLIYEDAVVHFRRPDHDFTEEIELGLPYRINIATEVDVQHYGDETQLRSFSIASSYAFATCVN